MGKMDQGFKDLLAEVARLIGEAVNERMESDGFHESLDEINRRMSGRYGRVINTIGLVMGLEVGTIPTPSGEERGKKPALSLKFQFGDNPEDQEMGKKFGLDEREMNQLLEQARREGGDGRGGTSAGTEAMPRPPEEAMKRRKTAEPADPRNISQITNDIRVSARELNLNSREAFSRHTKRNDLFRRKGIIFPGGAALENDTLWLGKIQELINFIQGEVKTPQLHKKILLVLERVIQLAGTGEL